MKFEEIKKGLVAFDTSGKEYVIEYIGDSFVVIVSGGYPRVYPVLDFMNEFQIKKQEPKFHLLKLYRSLRNNSYYFSVTDRPLGITGWEEVEYEIKNGKIWVIK